MSGPAGATTRRTTIRTALVKAALLLAGLLAVGLALRSVSGRLGPALVERWIVGQGLRGDLVFVLVAAAGCAAGLPRQAAGFLGGYAFGVWGGGALALLAQILGCIADFAWARFLAGDWLARRRWERLRRADAFLTRHPFRATLMFRLMPVGNNLALNLLAGLSRVSAPRFVLASAIGYVPQTAIFAMLGAGVRVSEGMQIAISAILFAVSVGLGLLLLRSRRQPISEAA